MNRLKKKYEINEKKNNDREIKNKLLVCNNKICIIKYNKIEK
jgi:hypothetical protein